MNHSITLLTKCRKDQFFTKLYGVGDDGQPTKLCDFNAGKWFHHTTTEVRSARDLHDKLVSFGNGEYLRVFAEVRPEHATKNVIRRNGEFMEEPEGGVDILYLDIDGKGSAWELDHPVDMMDSEQIGLVIRKKFEECGLDWLCEYDHVFMWSQSAWNGGHLRGHVYWLLDGRVPLQVLREFGKAWHLLWPYHTLDTGVWKAVQPDYIGRRRVEGGLKDIFNSDRERFHFIEGMGLFDEVPISELRDFISSTVQNPLVHQQSRQSVANIGDTYQDTLGMSGRPHPEGQINAWGYRAAAQAVHALGTKYVMDNLQHLAEEFHELAWAAISRNTKGERGDGNDRNTYDIPRYRQYLKSAVDRNFGAEKDQLNEILDEAIDRAQSGDLEALFCKDNLKKCAIAKDRHPAVWAKVVNRVKCDLRGIVSISDFRSGVRGQVINARNTHPGHDSEGGSEEDPGSVLLMRKILDKFEWIRDHEGRFWAGRKSGKEGSGYALYDLSSLKDIFYYLGSSLDPRIPQQFGKNTLSYLIGNLQLLDKDIDALSDEETEDKAYVSLKDMVVADQQYRDRRGVFWDLGLDSKGEHKVLHITSDRLETISQSKCQSQYGIIWKKEPKPGVHRRLAKDREYEGADDAYLLFKYVLCNEEDYVPVIAWLVNTLISSDSQLALEMVGRANSGKSSAGDFLRDLTDPQTTDVISGRNRKTVEGLSKSDKYRVIAENAVWYYDNVSGLSKSTQDLMCTVCTGMQVDLRIMYTSKMEAFWLKRPIILSGVHEVITKPDLRSRAVQIVYQKNAGVDAGFSSTQEMVRGWASDRPRILRALAEICQQVVGNLHRVRGRRGYYEEAIRVIMGDHYGEKFIQEQRLSTNLSAVESSPFCTAFSAFIQDSMEHNGYEDIHISARQLLDQYQKWLNSRWGSTLRIYDKEGEYIEFMLQEVDGNVERVTPRSVRGLFNQISKYANELNSMYGIVVGWDKGRRHKLISCDTIPI